MKNSINIGKLLVIPYDSYSNYINLPPSSLDRLSKLKLLISSTITAELGKQ